MVSISRVIRHVPVADSHRSHMGYGNSTHLLERGGSVETEPPIVRGVREKAVGMRVSMS